MTDGGSASSLPATLRHCTWSSLLSGSASLSCSGTVTVGGVELSELRDGAAEPDRACRGVDVDQAERDKPALELAVVDHEMGDGTSVQINDHAAAPCR